MELKNNAVLTGVVVSEPILRKTRYDTPYVIFDFNILPNENGEEFTIQCVCWNSSLAEDFSEHVETDDELLIMGYISEYTKQNKLQFVVTSYTHTEVLNYTPESIDHIHLMCPIINHKIKTSPVSDIEYLSLELETGKSKTCLCVNNDTENIDKLDGLEDTVGIISYWADISGKIDVLNKVTGQKDSSLGVTLNYLDIIPEYDQEILEDAWASYDPVFDNL